MGEDQPEEKGHTNLLPLQQTGCELHAPAPPARLEIGEHWKPKELPGAAMGRLRRPTRPWMLVSLCWWRAERNESMIARGDERRLTLAALALSS